MIEIGNQEIALRLITAAVLGSVVGLERERVEQPAGLRDHALVSVGSCLIMIISAYGFQHVTHAPDVVLDPSRIAAQVITGIGFIGAGTIVLRQNVVRGLTTAASIWAAAALGLAAGGGLYFSAIFATFLIIMILAGIKAIERRYSKRYHRTLITLIVHSKALTLEELQNMVAGGNMTWDRIDIREAKDAAQHDRVELSLTNTQPVLITALLDTLRANECVISVRSTIVNSRENARRTRRISA